MINVNETQQFYAVLDGAAPNLGVALVASIRTILGTVVSPNQPTIEVVIDGVHTGVYVSQFLSPGVEGEYLVRWDDGTGNAPYNEELIVGEDVLDDSTYAHPGADFSATLTAQAAIPDVSLAVVAPPSTVEIEPVDVSVVESPAGTYTALLTAPTEEREFVIVWLIGADYVADVLRVSALVPADFGHLEYEPTIEEVGALLRARTNNGRNVELGTFTSATRPTGVEALKLIVKAAQHVAVSLGGDIPNVLIAEVKGLVTLRAAMMIELSYFPEQVSSNRSPYQQYKDLYDEMLPLVRERVASEESLEIEDDTTLSSNAPAYSFPNNNLGGLVGWRTRW